MKLKTIIAVLLIGGSAMAQNVAVFSEGTNLYRDGTIIASNFVGNTFAPSFGTFASRTAPSLQADSVSVTNGTITSGTVTNTYFEDQDYLVVNESGVFEIYFGFTNSAAKPPRLFDFAGRYDGNPSHDIKFAGYNYASNSYIDFTADDDDLPSSTTDSAIEFSYPLDASEYISNNMSYVKIYHVGSAVGSHDIYIDQVKSLFATAVATNAGTWYDLQNGFLIVQSNNIAIDSNATTITTTSAGEYEWSWAVQFTGSTNCTFHIRHLTNGISSGAESIRTIGSKASVGSMSAFGGKYLPAGTTNSWQWKANCDDAYMSFVNGAAKLKKESN